MPLPAPSRLSTVAVWQVAREVGNRAEEESGEGSPEMMPSCEALEEAQVVVVKEFPGTTRASVAQEPLTAPAVQLAPA